MEWTGDWSDNSSKWNDKLRQEVSHLNKFNFEINNFVLARPGRALPTMVCFLWP